MKDGVYKALVRMGNKQAIKSIYVHYGIIRECGTDVPYLPSQIVKVLNDVEDTSNILDNLLGQ